MEEDSNVDTYLLSFSNSWEPCDRISDISFYSNSLLKKAQQIINSSTIVQDNSKVDLYLLGFSKSWESHDNICNISCYSNSLLKGGVHINTEPEINVEEKDMCSDAVSAQTNPTRTNITEKFYKCST